jgi:hypothetical protein
MSVSVSNPSINYGESTNIIATNFNNINILPNNNIVKIEQSGYEYIITVNPILSTLYSISGTDTLGNNINKSVTVYVNVTVLINPVSTNYNSPIILNAYGSEKYLWYPSTHLNINNSSSVVCIPLKNIRYTILGTDSYNVQTTTYLEVNVNTNLTFSPNEPTIYDGNLLNLSVSYLNTYNYTDLSYEWKSNLFTGLPPDCTTYKYGESIILHPYNNISYTVSILNNGNIVTEGTVDIKVIQKPSNIIDVDIIPYRLYKDVFNRNKNGLIQKIIKYKDLTKKIIYFYYTILQLAYKMEFNNKNGIPFSIKWLTLYQIKNESNEMILSFNQQWNFFKYINQYQDSNFKYLLNTINEIYLEKPQKILITPLLSN